MAESITIKALQDASLDAKSLEEVVNGNDTKQVTTRLGETYPSLSNALNQIDGQISDANDMLVESVTTLFTNGGLPATPFKTKALMTASALVDGDYAMVTEDTVNNGLYVKTVGDWVKSEYDPIAAANKYTDISVKNTISASLPSLVSFVDADYNEVMSLGTDGALNVEDIVFSREISGNRVKLSSLNLMDIKGFTHIKTDANYNIIEGHLTKGGTYSENPYEYKGYSIEDMRSKDLDSKTMTQTGLFFDKDNIQKTPMSFEVEVASFGDDGTLHQRMPAAVPIGSNTLFVAYAQFSSPNTDNKDGRLVGKVVQYDLEAQTANVGQLIEIDGEKTGSLSRHPNFIKLEDRLVMLFNSGIQLIQVESVDGGVTWGERKKISSTGSSLFLSLNSTISVAKSDGTKRHVMALYSSTNNITLAYSDDDCITWLKGGEIYKDSFKGLGELKLTEPSIALDSKGNILVAIRCEQQDKGVLFAVSKDLGATLIPIGENSKAITTISQKGFAQMAPQGSQGVPKIVLATPTIGGYGRMDFRVMLSYDDCNTFCAYYRPYNADTTVGYTHVLPLNDSNFVISMEKGRINAEQSIYLKFMNTAEIIK